MRAESLITALMLMAIAPPALGQNRIVSFQPDDNLVTGSIGGAVTFSGNRIVAQPLAPARGEIIGQGPVRVALLLPLSGDPGFADLGRAMANSARLAIDPTSTIHIVLKNTATADVAALTEEAIAEGADLILGPLKADEVIAAGSVARAADVPLIGFSNTASAASPGVYLLNLLPETELRRSLGYVLAAGPDKIAVVAPDNGFGRAQAQGFEDAARSFGISPASVAFFADEPQARAAIESLLVPLRNGEIDGIFLPDPATAPSFAALLAGVGVSRESIAIIGSSLWDGDRAILSAPYLAGAIYPAIEESGFAAFAAEYAARYGAAPPRLASLCYSAVMLANSSQLAMAPDRYGNGVLTSPRGFAGRDGPFRFAYDGKGELALMIRAVAPGGAMVAAASGF